MTTIFIAELLDDLADAVDTARTVATDQRWLTAIDTAWSWLLQQDTLEYDLDRWELTVNSPSGNEYKANGKCGCAAFVNSNACWHRAGAKLIRRAFERQQDKSRRARVLAEIAECF